MNKKSRRTPVTPTCRFCGQPATGQIGYFGHCDESEHIAYAQSLEVSRQHVSSHYDGD